MKNADKLLPDSFISQDATIQEMEDLQAFSFSPLKDGAEDSENEIDV